MFATYPFIQNSNSYAKQEDTDVQAQQLGSELVYSWSLGL